MEQLMKLNQDMVPAEVQRAMFEQELRDLLLELQVLERILKRGRKRRDELQSLLDE